MICHKCDWEGDTPEVCDRSVTMFYVCPECGFYVVDDAKSQKLEADARAFKESLPDTGD